jgi:hypothetical protein
MGSRDSRLLQRLKHGQTTRPLSCGFTRSLDDHYRQIIRRGGRFPEAADGCHKRLAQLARAERAVVLDGRGQTPLAKLFAFGVNGLRHTITVGDENAARLQLHQVRAELRVGQHTERRTSRLECARFVVRRHQDERRVRLASGSIST